MPKVIKTEYLKIAGIFLDTVYANKELEIYHKSLN